ncbi:MAG TPA: hypothetical protein VIO81_17085 [Methyloversatilis sp.]
MMFARKAPASTDALQDEYLPPVEALQTEPGAWFVSWERQLEAVMAWQAAGGNIDSEWDQWVAETPVNESVARVMNGGGPVTMATIVRMTTSMVSLRERLLRLQTRTTDVARTEMSLRRMPLPHAANGGGATSVRRPLTDENSQRVRALARECLEVLDTARAGIAALSSGPAHTERRQRSVLIDFPDRRAMH